MIEKDTSIPSSESRFFQDEHEITHWVESIEPLKLLCGLPDPRGHLLDRDEWPGVEHLCYGCRYAFQERREKANG